MIKKIRVKNFKCYGDKPVDFDLAPINFIYGDNGVGKSTFLQSISKIYEMYESRKEIEMMEFGNWQPDDSVAFSDVEMDGWNALSHKQIGADRIEILIRTGNGHVWRFSAEDDYMNLRDKASGFLVSAKNFYAEIPWVKHNEAPRLTRSDAESHLDVFEDLSFDPEQVNAMFRRVGLDYRCSDGVTLEDTTFGVQNISVTEVGTGIAGLFEIFKSLAKWENGILLLEEPETNVNEYHLQALVDLLIDEAKKRIATGGQLVVECHSEHVMLALMSLVGKKVVSSEDVAVFHVTKDAEGSHVVPCDVTDEGGIRGWPDARGFFAARDKILFGEWL